jgi:hypothetical protein
MSTYTHTPLPKVSTYIYPDSNILYTYTFGIVNPVQLCLPGSCPSLTAASSVPLSPFLSRAALVEKTKRSGEDFGIKV